jgi:type IV secretory pathway VirD2 relaxase
MKDENDFQPSLGRIGNRGAGKRYAHQVLAAINRAGGRSGRKSKFTGSRIGRGSGIGAVLARRDRFATYRQRRAIVKGRIVKLAGKGMNGAAAHLRYIQREGVSRDGERGELYSADKDRTDSKSFLERAEGDRHQFRFIVAPEDGIEYDELKTFTRNLMSQMEKDLGTRLDWVAADHFNTGHPHVHIIVRGKNDLSKDLIIAKDYMTVGIRQRAAEIVNFDLGPRSDLEIEQQLRNEMTAERLTSLDKQLLKMQENELGVSPSLVNDPARQTLLTGRLKHLERLGLAEERRPGQWHIDDDLEPTLRRMGERGDILKTMQREMTERNITRSAMDYEIYDPTSPQTKPVVGRVIARGLSDELNDRHYLVVDSLDGRALYIDIGRGDATEPTPEGSIIRVTPKSIEPRKVDRTVAEVAASNDGRYNIALHMNHDHHASFEFAEAHVRRLEAIRRATEDLTREPDGTWIIEPDHLARVVEYERALAKRTPVIVDKLSDLSIEQQITRDGATWLDRHLVSGHTEPPRDSIFGQELKEAFRQREQWLINQGLAEQTPGGVSFSSNMLSTLQERELSHVAGEIAQKSGLEYSEASFGDRIEGSVSKILNLASGKFAMIENSREFSLVPWRPILERHIGKEVSGIMREDGISWTIGRQRGLEIGGM